MQFCTNKPRFQNLRANWMKNYVLMYYSIMQLLNLFMVKSIKKKKMLESGTWYFKSTFNQTLCISLRGKSWLYLP